jgi:tetratricopeptide (TPR) repeat protein
MKLKLSILLLLAALAGAATGQPSEFVTGRAYYTDGDFKKAAAHFQLVLQTDPDDAAAYYWIGMSYQKLADIAAPFGGKYNARARVNLTKAMELAPNRPDYRGELFNFLLDSAAWRQASAILQSISESDPEYIYMHRRFEEARRESSSAEARLARVFLAAPRAVYGIANLPASAWSASVR